ncbi:N-acetylmuramoyl-L-alanine amidase [Candidatus Protochlamydia phocaeensis]|uniref:N-acetylmuramoyl-L-alanine amidase n=1 Tax=Candidatus Protochlamydia phocaeensis TaxID=1414722 RepID=UPI000838090C|nr:N-acetylmuramoyl-L-alanine amidase [Candidatus Protochlamydia phocaeensis]
MNVSFFPHIDSRLILLLFCLLFLCCLSLRAESYQDFDNYQGIYTSDEIAFKLNHYLVKDPALAKQFLLTKEAFFLYATEEDSQAHRPEFTLALASRPTSERPHSLPLPSTLAGLKIAIDPGHFGGRYAKLEQRWIEMDRPDSNQASDSISFNEGTLTLLTAKLLKNLLEDAGAQVLLTKETNGTGVYPEDFFDWLGRLNSSKSPFELFKDYNRLDLLARADKINAYKPDVTLIIHYNAHGGRDPITQQNIPQPYNYNMVFVGGSFCRNELSDFKSRYAFLHLLLTQTMDRSIALSEAILKEFVKQLNVPAVEEADPVPYLKNACINISKGVYARNLALTRLVHSPLCYGESLCQDNKQECLRLNDKSLVLEGIQGPERVKQVAMAYFKGLQAFTRNQAEQIQLR